MRRHKQGSGESGEAAVKLSYALSLLEAALLVALLAAYFGGQITARSMAFAIVGVLVVFAPVAFFLLGRDTARREER